MKLILTGAPGAGKGTQAAALSQKLGLGHISTGDMLRNEIRSGSELGKSAKCCIDRGELVPDDVIIAMVAKRILQPDCGNGFILDGFPRTIAQAEALRELTDIDLVVDIDVPPEVLVRRISGRRTCPKCAASYHVDTHEGEKCDNCGETLVTRDDDKPETVQHRIRVYHDKTQPLINYYSSLGLLVSVDGHRAPDDILSDIVELVMKY